MTNMRPFQVILMGLFLALGLGGLLVFAFYKGYLGSVNPYGSRVEIWGTFDDKPFTETISELTDLDENFHVVRYVEKDPRTFETELVNALASGSGPDLVILPQTMLLSNRDRIQPLPYVSFPQRDFKDRFIDGAEIFMLHDGIYGIPIAVDPLMLYWNRDIFATKNLAQPPKRWGEVTGVTLPAIVERDFSYNVTRAALAFGEFSNIRNAKEILAMLFIQAGSLMVYDVDDRLYIDLNKSVTQGVAPATSALRFYTEFSNPQKEVYTWNRSLPLDRDEFLAEDLALYFGFASEVNDIRRGNPNLNFDVAEVPQGDNASLTRGYGTFYTMAPMRASRNLQGAIKALFVLTNRQYADRYSEAIGLGTVHRASHATPPADPFFAVVEKASLIARGWLDPGEAQSDSIFRTMVEDVTSGRVREVSTAVSDASGRLRLLIGE